MKTLPHRSVLIFASMLILFMGTPILGQAAPPAQGPSDKSLIDRLNQETGGTVRISYHDQTGRVRFLGTSPDNSIPQPSTLGANPTIEEAGRGFLSTYGKLFGLKEPNKELTVMRERTLDDGRAFVRFQQNYQGIPILGGELIIQTDAKHNIISANGEILPDLNVGVVPAISAEAAKQTALALVAKNQSLTINDLISTEPELWVYNPAIMGGPGRQVSSLVWRMEVTPADLLPIREFVLVDAQLGFVTLHFNEIDTIKNRVIYDNANNPAFGLPGNGPIRTEGSGLSGISDVNYAYDYSGDTYDFYFNEHGRDSLDNGGLTLLSTTRYCPSGTSCPYANAFWNGSQMVYGNGFSAADDVVGHELTHGVTEFTSHLFYYYQSGAINESLSDVWGEFIDQTNGAGTDTAGVKWYLGEDVPGFGAIRYMANPPYFNDPDRMLSFYYYCGTSDTGGVHINSGVNNKAVYLMTDGGFFNSKTVSPLGISKVADLYYEVQTNLLTSGSNYNDLYDSLIQASINLGFSGADQQAVIDALDAVEMNQRPCSDPVEAPICPPGESPTYLFFDDLETTTSGKWTSAAITGSSEWYYPQTANPYAFDTTYATSGIYNIWGYDRPATSDYYIAMTSNVALPANAYMHFKHDWGFEGIGSTKYDGGVLEYSTNSGGSWIDAGVLFTDNGYNGTIYLFDTNPLKGRSAFTSNSHGYTASRLNLNSLAGQNVRFRFRIGTDSSVDAFGWFIDDVRIYTCAVGNTPPYYLSSGLPNQGIPKGGSKDNAINLWWYADDYEDSDSNITFSFCNTPDPGAGVTIDSSNRYIDINPNPAWEGSTPVCVRATDTGALQADSTFIVTTELTYLPIIMK